MVKQRRVQVMAGAGLLLAVLAWWWLRDSGPRPADPAAEAAAAGLNVVPRIGLDRLARRGGELAPGKRPLFDYGAPPPTPVPPPTLAPVPTMPTPEPVPTPTPPPPLTVKYMGSVDNGKGVQVALFVTDKKEVLAGQVGETVMNRFRVMKIGYESVDVQQLGFDQVQRLPLKPAAN
ncbi:MAG: hypothetical protein ABW221_00965 [Vicinamibacteria bacterium]